MEEILMPTVCDLLIFVHHFIPVTENQINLFTAELKHDAQWKLAPKVYCGATKYLSVFMDGIWQVFELLQWNYYQIFVFAM